MVESSQTFANAASQFPEYHGDASFCGCKETYDNNCAHLVSFALAKAGFSIKTAHKVINARCPNKLPIRAKEVRDWVKANTAAT